MQLFIRNKYNYYLKHCHQQHKLFSEGVNYMSNIFSQGFALVVGAGGNLPNTVADAKGLAGILTDPGRCAYPQNQVVLLTGPNATRGAILDTLTKLSQSTNAQSTVVVYFSGHGGQVQLGTGPVYYIMPYGYDTQRLTETAISGSEFTDQLQKIPTQKLLLLLDCCHAGGIGEVKGDGPQIAKGPLPSEAASLFAAGSGRAIIASSQADELSFAGQPYSAFTLALIEALCGSGVAQKDGYVRMTDVALYTREKVPQRTRNRQHPILDFKEADNFILAYYAGGNAQPKSLPFTVEPEIEPYPGAWTITFFDLRGQEVHGLQTNINIGEMRGGFFQPNWHVEGPVYQPQGNLYVGGQPGGGDISTSKVSRSNV
jgi:hypothetical protein